MRQLETIGTVEKLKRIEITPPPVELLLSDTPSLVWPEEVYENHDFIEQVETRKLLIKRLDIVLSKINRPDISLSEAVSSGQISEKEVAELYESLSELLNNPDYFHASLYIPFEFLPKSEIFSDDISNQAAKKFRESYMRAWYSILNIRDIRANFVDGDVLEVEMRTGDLPRVVKAAHLIPKLMESEMLTKKEVIRLLENSGDEILRRSVSDTLPVLHDLGFINSDDLSYLASSREDFIRETVDEIISGQHKIAGEIDSLPLSILSVQEKLRLEFVQIDSTDHDQPITKKRIEWLNGRDKNNVIDFLSDRVSLAILRKEIEISEIKNIVSEDVDISTSIVFTEGIRKAIEKIARSDVPLAKDTYHQYKNILLELWQNKNVEMKDCLSKLFCRLYRLKVIEIEQLNELNIIVPDLSEPFSKNLESMEEETEKIKKIVSAIENDPEISEFVYPLVIIYGSKLKGYSAENADMDVSVIIKPKTPLEKKGEIRERLKSIFGSEQIYGMVTEFWLEETNDNKNLAVRDFSKETDHEFGDKIWTHVLLGGVWEGKENTVTELRTKLLPPYFKETDEIIYDRRARELYLGELERDTLQYRLMHKGYERFYPSHNPLEKLHSEKIDGKSIFWDSGYRDTAIKLFASRVFLPRI